jgi:hypothetical protein
MPLQWPVDVKVVKGLFNQENGNKTQKQKHNINNTTHRSENGIWYSYAVASGHG